TKVKALALQFGVSEHSMGNYLNGKRSIPYDILVKFARHYNVTTDYLLGLTDSPAIPCPLSDEERKLIEQFRTLSREQKELILQSIALMCRQNERG
ncbi:MAG: helix-turn-helix transcriptional regulator, partial [Clostridiales bacterium]|nr:helix-turn-helix transcriptional regulator [Clostridiales bacterium]